MTDRDRRIVSRLELLWAHALPTWPARFRNALEACLADSFLFDRASIVASCRPEVRHVRVVCSVCGGTDVQVKTYIDPNTLKLIDDGALDTLEEMTKNDETWCSDCDDCTTLLEEEIHNERTD